MYNKTLQTDLSDMFNINLKSTCLVKERFLEYVKNKEYIISNVCLNVLII